MRTRIAEAEQRVAAAQEERRAVMTESLVRLNQDMRALRAEYPACPQATQ
jgi:hypothetical protein